jgi:hypothetical protein
VTQRQLAVFGVPTPDAQVPRTGTGQYSGVAFGYGDLSGSPIDVDGTASLSVDFGAGTVQSALNLGTRPAGGGAFTPFETIEYRGMMGSGRFSGNVVDPAASGSFQGSLFGPNASEFGFLFGYSKLVNGNNRITINGGAVGRRN